LANDGVFKSALFGGFNKKNVLQYIEQLNIRAQTELRSMEERLEQINQERNDFAGQFYEKDRTIEALEKSLEQQQADNLSLGETVEKMDQELAHYKGAVRQKDYDIRVLEEKNKQLSFKLESFMYKSRRYDELNEAVGEAITEAKRTADQIVKESNRQATAIANAAQKELDKISAKLMAFKGEVSNLKAHVSRVDRDILQQLGEMNQVLDKALNVVQINQEEFCQQAVEKARTAVNDQQVKFHLVNEREKEASKKLRNLEQPGAIDQSRDAVHFGDHFSMSNNKKFFRFALEK